MKKAQANKSVLCLIIATILLSMNTVSADEEVKITTDEQAKEILMGYDWECEWKDPYFSGTTKMVYEEVSLKKVTAKVKNSYCPDGWGKYKGKIKKGRESGKSYDLPSPCQGSTSGSGKLYKSSDGSYYTKGTYRPSGYDAQGKTTCKAVPK